LTPRTTLAAMSRDDFYFRISVCWVCIILAMMLALIIVP
jgi:hypothetical protein